MPPSPVPLELSQGGLQPDSLPGLAIGIDGCPAGWVAACAVSYAPDPHDCSRTVPTDPLLLVRGTLVDLLAACCDAAQVPLASGRWLVCVDMPIGLPDAGRRQADHLARQRVARGRASSVFAVPCRDAITADSYRLACDINQQRSGWKLSVQLWNLRSRMLEVDRFFDSNPAAHLYECHPEVAFADLASRVQGRLTHAKSHVVGLLQRHELLHRWGAIASPPAAWFEAAAERAVGADPDDVLDAVACMTVAREVLTSRAGEFLPTPVPTDRLGRRMAILTLGLGKRAASCDDSPPRR